jgi:predicted nucleic acid-binding protein
VDSSVWGDFFNGFDSPQKIQLSKFLNEGQTIFITGIVVSEILAGIKDEKSFSQIKQILSDLFFVDPLFEHHVKAAEFYRHLRSKGITIRSIVDCLIAVLVIENSLMLLYKDRDFEYIQQYYPELNLIKI